MFTSATARDSAELLHMSFASSDASEGIPLSRHTRDAAARSASYSLTAPAGVADSAALYFTVLVAVTTMSSAHADAPVQSVAHAISTIFPVMLSIFMSHLPVSFWGLNTPVASGAGRGAEAGGMR